MYGRRQLPHVSCATSSFSAGLRRFQAAAWASAAPASTSGRSRKLSNASMISVRVYRSSSHGWSPKCFIKAQSICHQFSGGGGADFFFPREQSLVHQGGPLDFAFV